MVERGITRAIHAFALRATLGAFKLRTSSMIFVPSGPASQFKLIPDEFVAPGDFVEPEFEPNPHYLPNTKKPLKGAF
jgi:hypothetical protein